MLICIYAFGDQGRMQTQRDVHSGVAGRDTWVMCWIMGWRGMIEAARLEMEGELVSVL